LNTKKNYKQFCTKTDISAGNGSRAASMSTVFQSVEVAAMWLKNDCKFWVETGDGSKAKGSSKAQRRTEDGRKDNDSTSSEVKKQSSSEKSSLENL
jgi:hypothetical protein